MVALHTRESWALLHSGSAVSVEQKIESRSSVVQEHGMASAVIFAAAASVLESPHACYAK